MAKGEKTTTQGSQSQQTQYTPTAEETQFNQLQLGQAQAFDPYQRQMNVNAANDINALLTGNSGINGNPTLPGFLGQAAAGISPEVTQNIVNQSLRDVNGQLAKSGAGTMLESGASQAIGARTAADIRTQAEQFNINNWLQMLNLGVGGQAQVQQPIGQSNAQLGSRLAGLAGSSTSGTSSGSTIGANPFLSSFQRSLGTTLGAPFIGSGRGNFGFGGRTSYGA